MQNKTRILIGTLLVMAMLLFTTWAIQAGSGGSYEIDWYSMDSGGTMATTGGSFELQGTIGQADTAVIAQDTYEIQAGFWSGAVDSGPYQLYLPLIQK